MSKKQRKRIVMRDAAGNITYDSDAIQKLILKLADSPLISFSSGSISPQSKWAKETIKLLKEHGEMKNIDISFKKKRAKILFMCGVGLEIINFVK